MLKCGDRILIKGNILVIVNKIIIDNVIGHTLQGDMMFFNTDMIIKIYERASLCDAMTSIHI